MALRILITGGFGFVGGRLAVHLNQAGHQIILGSRSLKKIPSWLPEAEFSEVLWHSDNSLESICKNVDIVIQAAGMNANDSAKDPIGALNSNGVATLRLLNAACRASVKRFVYLSTAHIYADPLVGVISENTCPKNLHPYATSHFAGEQAVLSASQKGFIQGVVLRISNAFGAPTHEDVNCWTLFVNNLCQQAIRTRKLKLLSNVNQQRNFIAMRRVCRKTELLVTDILNERKLGVFNIGSTSSKTLLNMAVIIQERCKRVLGFEPEIQYNNKLKDPIITPLIYKTMRLHKKDTDFDENSDLKEIDQLIEYCKSIYLDKKSNNE